MGRPLTSIKYASKFGRLKVLGVVDENKYLCRCDCGNQKTFTAHQITSGNVKSCGCLRREGRNPRHGMSKSRTYYSWASMMSRCYNEKVKDFKNWGGRGIRVDERWHLFDNFYADMGEKPDGLSLDRIDNEKGYGPGNCRWATRLMQQQNRRKTYAR